MDVLNNKQIQDSISNGNDRRRFLTATTAVVGGTGLALAAIPFIASMRPSQSTQSAGAPVQVDISKIQAGMQIQIEWGGRPVWILRRDQSMLKQLDSTESIAHLLDADSQMESQQPVYAQNSYRSISPEVFVAIGICTHLGCIPTYRPEINLGADWHGGYFCACHGSKFDLAGRVYKGMPTPSNLVIPPYRFINESIIEIGVDSVEAT